MLVALVGGGALPGCSTPVPTPTLTSVTPGRLCSGQQGTLTLAGGGFVARLADVLGQPAAETPAVSATMVAAPQGAPVAGAPVALPSRWQSVEQLAVDLAADALPAGLYDVAVTNPGGARATLPRSLTMSPSPRVDNVAPMLLCAPGGMFAVHGDGFVDGATASIVDPMSGIAITATQVTVTSPMQLTATFGSNGFADNAKLDFTVVNPDGCAGTLAGAVKRKNMDAGCP